MEKVFLASSHFAVVGASTSRAKFGNKVLRCYLQNGKTVIPINPREPSIEGVACMENLTKAAAHFTEEDVDLKDVGISVVTPPSVTAGIVEEASKLGFSRLWLQPGSESAEVLSKAAEGGLDVIQGEPCVLVHLGFDEESKL